MYLLPIQVPIYVDGGSNFVTTEWHRSLLLLRDSLNGRFGDVAVAAPSLPAKNASVEQALIEVKADAEGLRLFPSFDLRCRARQFWLKQRGRWQADLLTLADRAEVVHAGVDDVYRPISFEGFRIGVKLKKPTVFVQDTDTVVQQRQLAVDYDLPTRAKVGVYNLIYERMCRWGVARADLALLKGTALMRRYGGYARNAREFHDTSYSAADVIPADDLTRRLSTLAEPRPLRLVYCGRLTGRKGVDRSLRILARAIAGGASLRFDIIGDGAQREPLQKLAAELKLADHVQFLGALPYDAALLKRLGEYDALLFTPTAEDTPRMIFDGYAAALPLIAFAIDYVRERSEQEHATVVLPFEQIDASAKVLIDLDKNRGRLAELARAARTAAEYHTCENWYRRRTQWTIEAFERHGK